MAKKKIKKPVDDDDDDDNDEDDESHVPNYELDESVFSFTVETLERHWVEQARNTFKMGKNLALANLKVNQAKANLKLVDAELSTEIRQNPEDYGIAKVTEGSIEAVLLSLKRHQKAVTRVNEALYEQDILQAGMTSLMDKRHALANTVSIKLATVRGDPLSPQMDKEEVEELVKKYIRKMTKKGVG